LGIVERFACAALDYWEVGGLGKGDWFACDDAGDDFLAAGVLDERHFGDAVLLIVA
jgi:hypothetical protein